MSTLPVKQNLDSVKTRPHKAAMATKQLEKRRKRRPGTASATRPARVAAKGGTPYHHGALHDALLQAAERILEREGIAGLTLRAAAREAGVSHAAPTHHFGDMTGLLSELAAVGFRRFGASLAQAAATGTTPDERMCASGEAYVAFARKHPGMFMLMFRSERLDGDRPSLHTAMADAFGVLMRGVSERRGDGPAPPLGMIADAVHSWSLVHGFAMLLLDHRLDHILGELPKGTDARDLLRAVLAGK